MIEKIKKVKENMGKKETKTEEKKTETKTEEKKEESPGVSPTSELYKSALDKINNAAIR